MLGTIEASVNTVSYQLEFIFMNVLAIILVHILVKWNLCCLLYDIVRPIWVRNVKGKKLYVISVYF